MFLNGQEGSAQEDELLFAVGVVFPGDFTNYRLPKPPAIDLDSLIKENDRKLLSQVAARANGGAQDSLSFGIKGLEPSRILDTNRPAELVLKPVRTNARTISTLPLVPLLHPHQGRVPLPGHLQASRRPVEYAGDASTLR
ncbi:hypothetical protein ACJZ2D_012142 [Fusarium nematophilum]